MRTLAVVLGLAFPTVASAASYGTAGCGLGSIVFGDEPGMIQIVAATLNSTGVQTSGITSGTSNCDEAPMNAALDQELFLATNYASVMKDAAAGQGEYLSTLGTLMGCEATAMPEFSSLAQKQHETLFSNAKADTTLKNLKQAMGSNAVLSASCVRI